MMLAEIIEAEAIRATIALDHLNLSNVLPKHLCVLCGALRLADPRLRLIVVCMATLDRLPNRLVVGVGIRRPRRETRRLGYTLRLLLIPKVTVLLICLIWVTLRGCNTILLLFDDLLLLGVVSTVRG